MPLRSPFLARLGRDFVRAGDLYYQRGDLPRAARMYARAGRFPQAAKLRLQLGDVDGAVKLHLESGNPREAADVLAGVGRLREAVQHYEAAGAVRQAAETCLRLEQLPRAARLFERAEAWGEAAACYERAGDVDAALRAMALESERLARERSDMSSTAPGRSEERRRLDVHRAELLARVGRKGEAADILRELRQAAHAATLYEQAGRMEEAIAAWLQTHDLDRALRLLDQAPNLEPAVRAEVLRRSGRHAEAATLLVELGRRQEAAGSFEAAEDWERAAALWEEVGESEQAGHAWYRAERYADAGRAFAAARLYDWAAEAHARAGDHLAAAAVCLDAGQPFRAAAHFLKGRDPGAASRALQAVAADNPAYERATLALVPLLLEQGLAQGALHRLRSLPPPAAAAPDRLYWEGRVRESLGELREARLAYEKAAAVQIDFRDVAARLQALRERELHGTGPVSVELPETGPLATAALSTLESGPAAPAGRAPTLPTGRLLAGRYEILGELGHGGMSRVYRARDRELGEEVAIKTLISRASDRGPEEEERLLREVQICRRVTHPNVVRVYDIGRFPGGVFLTMELVEGEPLDLVLREQAPLPLGRVKSLLREIARGLEAAHALRIVHRDLKPGNVVVVGEKVKILDFGIARLAGQDVQLTAPGDAIGSPMYMSPEQIRGLPLDGRSDFYSLGVLAFQALTGKTPHSGQSPSEIILKHLQDPPADLRELRPGLPEEWLAFVSRLLSKAPAGRYADAPAVLAAIEELPE